jgi:hypothetical protein
VTVKLFSMSVYKAFSHVEKELDMLVALSPLV